MSEQVAKKKMSPTNARALNTMRQRLKKHNPAYQEQMDAFREKPESSEEEAASGAAVHEHSVGLGLEVSRVRGKDRYTEKRSTGSRQQQHHKHSVDSHTLPVLSGGFLVCNWQHACHTSAPLIRA